MRLKEKIVVQGRELEEGAKENDDQKRQPRFVNYNKIQYVHLKCIYWFIYLLVT